MKFFALAIAMLFLFLQNVKAQTVDYKTGIGIRAGDPSGITVKHFLDPKQAIEGILSFWPWGPSLTVLYEFHETAFDVPGLVWFYGLGGHIRAYPDSWRSSYRGWHRDYERYNSRLGLGVDGIIGLEYKIPPIPITLSLDLKPMIEFTTYGNVYIGIDPGLSIRYVFGN